MKVKEKEITDVDRDIIKYISENKEFDNIIENDDREEVMLALSDIRKNIISWYPFEENCTILEIGADYGQITEELCRKANKVVSYEWNEEKKKALMQRHKNIKNLTVIDNLQNIEEKFDYITLIGLENITDDISEIFEKSKNMLEPEGKLLIAINNKYSVKNFSTKDRLEEFLKDDSEMYTLDKIIEELKYTGFGAQKVYYALTDYKFPNVLFIDDEKIARNELGRNIIYNNKETIKLFEENELIDRLLKDNISFKNFANSFFIEAFNGKYIDNEIRLVAFSNMRKNKYKIKTIMKKDFVYKYPDNEESEEHIKDVKKNIDIMLGTELKTLDTYDEEKVISKYVENDTLDEVLYRMAQKDKNQAIELIKRYKQKLLECLPESKTEENVFDRYDIKYDIETVKNMKFTQYGLWDLIFQNCFYIENDFYFYDQEWMEENVPIDFMLYRAVKYFIKIRKYITLEELYEILELDEEKVRIFEELDNKLQEKNRNNMVWQMQKNGKNVEELRIQKLTDNHTMNLLYIELEDKNEKIEELKNVIKELEEKNKNIEASESERKQEINELENELRIIKNSKSWKMVTTLKKIMGKK